MFFELPDVCDGVVGLNASSQVSHQGVVSCLTKGLGLNFDLVGGFSPHSLARNRGCCFGVSFCTTVSFCFDLVPLHSSLQVLGSAALIGGFKLVSGVLRSQPVLSFEGNFPVAL